MCVCVCVVGGGEMEEHSRQREKHELRHRVGTVWRWCYPAWPGKV